MVASNQYCVVYIMPDFSYCVWHNLVCCRTVERDYVDASSTTATIMSTFRQTLVRARVLLPIARLVFKCWEIIIKLPDSLGSSGSVVVLVHPLGRYITVVTLTTCP